MQTMQLTKNKHLRISEMWVVENDSKTRTRTMAAASAATDGAPETRARIRPGTFGKIKVG